jgi:hypothetical protein
MGTFWYPWMDLDFLFMEKTTLITLFKSTTNPGDYIEVTLYTYILIILNPESNWMWTCSVYYNCTEKPP